MADDRSCQFIVGFNMDGEGDPIFCGKIAPIKTKSGSWVCAEHYDEWTVEAQSRTGKRIVL